MEKMMNTSSKKLHFVLVHGLGQGAWCWYKLRTLLESLGHQVTALDLAASGINLNNLNEVDTMLEYSQPLMEFMATISGEERVILVGHSLGGLNIAYAMENFPQKVSIGVFLTAFMPDTMHPPSYILDKGKQFSEMASKDTFLDSRISSEEGPGKPKTTILFGPKFMASMLYQRSPAEDLSLALMLARPGSMFREDLSTAAKFSDEGYGSVNRAFLVCEEDKAITKDFQIWMIENSPVKEVKEIKGSDHFAMISKPMEVCQALLEIANKYT